MTFHAQSHPHALPGTLRAPAGMPLPATAVIEAPRHEVGLRQWLDVAGGIAFALLIGIVCRGVGSELVAGRAGWAPVIAWESVWLVAAMLCSPLMPSAIQHDISWRSTFEGLTLDWPELLYATWVLGTFVALVGELVVEAGPLGFALAVGIAEECIFRVLLLGWLVGRLPAPHALAVSAVVFGLAHVHDWSNLSLLALLSVVPQIAGGFVLGAVYLRTRNPIGPILAHAYWDFPYFMALGVVSGGGTEAGMPTVSSLAPWIGFIIYGLWLVRSGVPLSGRVEPVGCTCGRCELHQKTGQFAPVQR